MKTARAGNWTPLNPSCAKDATGPSLPQRNHHVRRAAGAHRCAFVFVALTISLPLASAQHFVGADLANGKSIHVEKRCAACHRDKTGRDEAFIYQRDDRKVKTLYDLRRYVSLCNMELRLELFPEDERDVAAFVNEQFYRLSR